MTAASKWVDEAMDMADRVWWADDDAVSYRRADLRECLTTQAALCEQLAEALKEYIAAGDQYAKPHADDVLLMLRFGDADVAARAALRAYEGSKQ